MIQGAALPGWAGEETGLTLTNLTYRPGQFAISTLTDATPEERLAVKVILG